MTRREKKKNHQQKASSISSNSNNKTSRFFKGVKSFLSNHHHHHHSSNNQRQQQVSTAEKEEEEAVEQENKEGVAVTLTTEFNTKNTTTASLLNPTSFNFVPTQSNNFNSSYFFVGAGAGRDNFHKAYVHYEPKKAQVIIGTAANSDEHSNKKRRNNTNKVEISVEQYAWLIQQLQEEKILFNSWGELFDNKAFSPPDNMLSIIITEKSSSVETTGTIGKRLKRLFSTSNEEKKRNLFSVSPPALQRNVFLLPKSLLLQASCYIPMTKPLPPPILEIHYNLLNNQPFQIINQGYKEQLKRYCKHITFCSHELFSILQQQQQQEEEPSPPSSILVNEDQQQQQLQIVKIKCADNCLLNLGNLSTIINVQPKKEVPISSSSVVNTATKKSSNKKKRASLVAATPVQQSIMFPISFTQPYNNLTIKNLKQQQLQQQQQIEREKKFMSSAIQPPTSSLSKRNAAFDSLNRRQKPHAISAFQFIPPDRAISSLSSISSISEYSDTAAGDNVDIINEEEEEIVEEQQEAQEEKKTSNTALPPPQQVIEEKYGFVAIDNENEEILVVFPGSSMSHNTLKNVSFATVPWHEIENAMINSPIRQQQQKFESEQVVVEYEDETPYVLECALTAWNRCEMRVVTLLMRLCSALPSQYKVVIIGHSLGGGKKKRLYSLVMKPIS